MSRRAKYATWTKYAPYIKIIRKALDIPDTVEFNVIFNSAHIYRRGSAFYDKKTNSGDIKVYKGLSHIDTLRTLMHEIKHVQQYYTGRLKGVGVYAEWENQPAVIYSTSGKNYKKYRNSAWEIEARAFEELVVELFPEGKILNNRQQIGKINGVTFYRIRE